MFYVGFTNYLERRIKEHKTKQVKGFTYNYNLSKLVYFEEFENSFEAFQRERQMKKRKRQWKLNLINEMNPEWKDLSKDWYTD